MFNENVWKYGESLVINYLKNKNYKILYQNFRCKFAELDIVALYSKKLQKRAIKIEFKQKIKQMSSKNEKTMFKFSIKSRLKNLKDVLVIVEVKTRSNDNFGTGLDAIDREKVVHMKRGAEYLLKQKKYQNMQIRFDIASVDGNKLTYIENAF